MGMASLTDASKYDLLMRAAHSRLSKDKKKEISVDLNFFTFASFSWWPGNTTGPISAGCFPPTAPSKQSSLKAELLIYYSWGGSRTIWSSVDAHRDKSSSTLLHVTDLEEMARVVRQKHQQYDARCAEATTFTLRKIKSALVFVWSKAKKLTRRIGMRLEVSNQLNNF